MLNVLFAFLLFVAGSLPAPRVEQDPNPIVATCVVDGTTVNVHADRMLSVVELADEGTPLASFAFEGREVDAETIAPLLPPGDPLPMLTTTWTDAQGVQHTVSTPIVSQTPAGLAAATSLHDRLVAIQQRAHPPKPV